MTYEEALEIAMEELYDAVEVLRRNNKGYPSRVDLECNRLLTARNVLCKALEEAGESYDQTALELCERCGWKTVVPDDGCLNCKKREWVGLTPEDIPDDPDPRFDTDEFLLGMKLAEALLKEKNA